MLIYTLILVAIENEVVDSVIYMENIGYVYTNDDYKKKGNDDGWSKEYAAQDMCKKHFGFVTLNCSSMI